MPRFNNGFFNNEASGGIPNVKVLTEYQENLSSQADGTNLSFDTDKTIDGTLQVSINGLIYSEADGNISFQEGETEFTISFAPQSDDIVVAIFKSFE